MKQRLECEGFTPFSFTGEGKKGIILHPQNSMYQQIAGEGEG